MIKSGGLQLEIMENMVEDIANFNSPVAIAVSLGVAYQATDNTKPAMCCVNLSSTAALTLGGGQTYAADIAIGPDATVATSPNGTVVGSYRNSQTGGVVVGVALNARLDTPCAFCLPKGWYFAVRQVGGTLAVTILSTLNQSIG